MDQEQEHSVDISKHDKVLLPFTSAHQGSHKARRGGNLVEVATKTSNKLLS